MDWSVWVDVAIIFFIIIGGWRGYREGVFVASANLIGLVVSLLLGFWLYGYLASFLLQYWTIPIGLMNIFSFLLIAFVADGLITAAVLLIGNKYGRRLALTELTRWTGVIPGIGSAVITLAYLVAVISGMPLEHPIKVAVTQASASGPLIELTNQSGLPVDKLVGPAIQDLSQLFTVQPGSSEMVDLGFVVQDPELTSVAEEQMLALVNQERQKEGARPLVMDESLRKLARSHSLDMYQRGYFSHHTPEGKDPFDRMKEFNIDYMAAGENLALAPTVEMAHEGLMNSPGHRRNILDPNYHKVGIGAYQHPRYGIMFSQEFTD